MYSDLAGSRDQSPRRYPLRMQGCDESLSPNRCIDGHHIKFHLALDHDKPFQETCPDRFRETKDFRVEDVRAVDFQSLIRAELCLIEFGYGAGPQPRQG